MKSYLRNITIDLQNSDTQKIQLAIAINFISSKNVEKERVIHSRNDNIKLTSYNDVDDELLESLRSRYQGNLETSVTGIDFIFDLVQLMYYRCHKVNFRRSSSYIDSPDWIKKKKATKIQKIQMINSTQDDQKRKHDEK